MKEEIRICRKCGRPVSVITYGVYRKVLVDAEAVTVMADICGEQFIRIDGSKVRAREVPISEESRMVEYAYRPHRKTCGVEE